MKKTETRRAASGKTPGDLFRSIIGETQVMEQLKQLVKEAAASEARILISGESGTGKDLAAQEIHRGSPRAAHPFVTVTCAAIPDTLIESELFGYRKGAFTGALTDHRGKIESAHRGTLFLDEVGDLSPGAQAKVLRVIQEQRVEPVGSEGSIFVDVRILASTNKNLAAACAAGRFREDLFYRLNVIPIGIPPLRERKDDIPLLFRYFLSDLGARMELGPDGETFLVSCQWPGNVRELRNLAERCAVRLSSGTVLGMEELQSLLFDKASGIPEERKRILDLRNALDKGYNEAKELFERQYLRYQLEKHGGSVSRTAAAAGLSAGGLRVKLEKYRLL